MLKFSIEADNIDNSLISDYTPYFPTSEMMQKSYEALKKLKAKIDKKGTIMTGQMVCTRG